MTPPFIVYALPRSRTFWLSKFLSHGGWHVAHDEICRLRSLDDARAWFSQPLTGTVETAAAPWWRLVPSDVRTVIVRRPVADVVASLLRLGFDPAVEPLMRRLDAKLRQIETRVPCLSVKFDELATEDGCRRVWEYCLSHAFDREWWQRVSALNLQADVAAQVRYYQAYQKPLEKLAKQAKFRTIANMQPAPGEIEGLTIQQEPAEDFYRDGPELFGEHLVQVGEAPDAFTEKNVPLHRVLAELGCIQVTTARSNGRMFGYLMAVISPSLEAENRPIAIHTTFFASPSVRGLGMKLQRASVQALRDRGVQEIYWRAGVRGDGPRTSAICRRLGAVADGELFKLDLKEAA